MVYYQLLSDMKELFCMETTKVPLALAKNPVHHQRSKHIDIRYHFVRDEVQKGHVDLRYVPTEDNVADVFTKPVSKPRLAKFIKHLTGT